MKIRRCGWYLRLLRLGLAMALMGCATTSDEDVKRLDSRINHHIGLELPSNTDDWNNTDLGLWMTMQGGG
ncbi:MAG: hypothetical protein M0P73_02715 [Syntrophobacterales bacterium]|jgi:hypothetical protein|nr:hypothetical protein [Syntrophobacterales bacterium]